MIKIENVVLPSPAQWTAILRGMRNPMNSWDKMDSYSTHIENPETLETSEFEFFMGDDDYRLALKLAKAGKDHRKFLRMIPVIVDITAPMYWWKEFDTYKVGTVRNSCSTMHKIHSKEFTIDDFSYEKLDGEFREGFEEIIRLLNIARANFNATKDKKYWWQMIQLLPSSYNQKSTLFLNYEVLASMYHSRKAHKLDEWRIFCEWIKSLPYSELITKEE